MKMSKQDMIDWHENIIKKYPVDIQIELRVARTKFLVYWKD